MLLLIVISILISIAFLLIILYFNNSFKYWKNLNVPHVKGRIPFGLGNPLWDDKGIHFHLKQTYRHFKTKGEKFAGFYLGPKPVLLATHPETVKQVLRTSFEHFEGNGNVFDEKSEPLGAHLLNLEGERWKDMRVRLTPTFTSGKMKTMFETVLKCGEKLEEFIKEDSMEIKETLACYTTDVIASCAFGLESNSLKNPDTEFRFYGRKAFESDWKTSLRRFLNVVCPELVKTLKLPLFNRESTNFFMGVIKKVVEFRRNHYVKRNDFVDLLMNIEGTGFTIEEIAAQAFVFFLAGFETSSTTMSFCLYELAFHPEIQDKVREEIRSVIKNNGGKLSYRGLMELKYLEQVIKETLRKHPPVPMLKKACNKDLELSNGVVFKKGQLVFLSVLGLHYDEEYFPRAERFDPDRFSDRNTSKIPPYAFIPFGEGPRMCIGLRFGMMQTKIGILSILKSHQVTPHPSLAYPIEYEPKNAILTTRGPLLLKFERLMT